MTAFHFYELNCDCDGCPSSYSASSGRADKTRAFAAKFGWAHGVRSPNVGRGGLAKSLDYCPRHAHLIGDLKHKALPEHARPVERNESAHCGDVDSSGCDK